MANIITASRIVISIFLLFCPTLSPIFIALYITAGITDMIDGAVARKTGSVSEFGSRLDTVADIVFVAVCLIKLLPVMHIASFIYIWIAAIAMIKVANITVGYIRQKKLISVHSILNKVTGGLLFVLPLTQTFIDIGYSAVVVCVVATIAAIHEGWQVGRSVMD